MLGTRTAARATRHLQRRPAPQLAMPARPQLVPRSSYAPSLQRPGPARYAARVLRPHLLAPLLLALACDTGPADSAPDAPVVAELAVCDPVADWDTLVEDALLAQLNALRREGGRCGDLSFGPAPGLGSDPTLRCAARLHSLDMVTRVYLAQVDPDGVATGPRLDALGFTASTFGENVGFVQAGPDLDPELVARALLLSWQDNPSTCWKLLADELEVVGIGATPGSFDPKDLDPVEGFTVTATFAAP